MSPVEHDAIGERGRVLFAERFDIGAAAEGLRDLMAQVAQGRG